MVIIARITRALCFPSGNTFYRNLFQTPSPGYIRFLASSTTQEQENDHFIDHCAEQGLSIARRSPPLTGIQALEAVKWLLKAERSNRTDVLHALGCLHYLYSEEMNNVERTEMSLEDARNAVINDVKTMRRKVIEEKKRKRINNATTDHQNNNGIILSHTVSKLLSPRITNQDAFYWFEAAAKAGHTMSMFYMANMAMEESGEAEFNADFAKKWYLRAGTEHPPIPDAFFQLARMYHESNNPQIDRALELYFRAANGGSSAALFFLGIGKIVGNDELNIDVNPIEGVKMLKKAAEQGHPEALHHLALIYNDGNEMAGIMPNKEKFWEYLNKAISFGSSSSQFLMGSIYHKGLYGHNVDNEKALYWFELAVQNGHAEAAFCAGVMWYHGWGCKKDLTRAFELYQAAGEGGYVLAWREVASMHLLGEGVAQCEATARTILKVMEPSITAAEKSVNS